MRNLRRESRPSDPNRQHIFHPRLGWIALLERITPYPLDGTDAAELCRQQMPDCQIFDLALAFVPLRKHLPPHQRKSAPVELAVALTVWAWAILAVAMPADAKITPIFTMFRSFPAG